MSTAKHGHTGILLINLGTPDNTSTKAVRRYLREFLTDPRVIDIPQIARWLLVYGAILPFRPKQSARSYQKIWQTDGSPLLVYSQQLATGLAKQLAQQSDDYQVELAMRYGNPSIASALAKLQHCHRLIILPLFPQYSSAASGSAMEKAMKQIASGWNIPDVTVINNFYAHPAFIKTSAQVIQEHQPPHETDLFLFSYHGLPERHLTKSHCQADCDKRAECPSVGNANYFCYRAQCYETSRLLAHELNLSSEQYRVSFQSRLGRTPWIGPYTDELLPQLKSEGVEHLTVACPSFVADCLETIEEIGMQAQQQWQELGGKQLKLVPCLNADQRWIQAVQQIIQDQTN